MSLLSTLRERSDEQSDSSWSRWVMPSGAGLGGAAGALVAGAVEPWVVPGAVIAGIGGGLGAAAGMVVAVTLD